MNVHSFFLDNPYPILLYLYKSLSTIPQNSEGGILMRELGLAFKGLRYHFKKCICDGFYAAVEGVLKPFIKWNRKNHVTEVSN